jgi:hypothetical protein
MVALGRGIPSAFMVQDPNARSVLEALREAVLMLTSTAALGSQAKASAVASGFVDAAKLIEQGSFISVENLGNGKVRISCTISPSAVSGGGGGSSGPAYDYLSKLKDVAIEDVADGETLVYEEDSEAWINAPAPSGSAENPETYDTIGGTTEGNEGEQTDTWTAGDTKGLWLYVQTRQGYYHGGDKKWYAYVRKLVFDLNGGLYSVSAETRVEIDAPEE